MIQNKNVPKKKINKMNVEELKTLYTYLLKTNQQNSLRFKHVSNRLKAKGVF